MKVSFLAGPLGKSGGGIPFSVLPLARQLAGAGHDINVLSSEQTNADYAQWLPARITEFPYKGPEQFSYCPALASALSAARPDIVHTHGLWRHLSIIAKNWQARTNGKRVVTAHGMLSATALQVSNWKKQIALKLYEGAHLRGAHCIHALSKGELQAIRSFGLKNPVALVPNGVAVVPTVARMNPEWRQFVPDGKKILLYLGRFHPIKGVSELLDGWCAAHESMPDNQWVLVIAGWDDANMLDSMRRNVADRGLEDSLILAGPQFDSDKAASLDAADAFILPSKSEGLPVTILEAWSHGLPVLMSRHCNLDIGFKSGAAIETDASPASVLSGLKELFAATEDERQIMGSKGRALVEQQFTWDAVAAKMSAVYEWILGSGPVPDYVDK